MSALTKRLQVIKYFAVYAQHNLNIIEDKHIWFNCALDCRTKSFCSCHREGKGDMRVPKPQRTCICAYLSLNCHRICSCIHRGYGKHDTKCPTSVQRDNSTAAPHSGGHTVSSLPEASVLAHAATFPGAFALLLDPRTKN